jgi:lipopolysaccharide export system permease protein
MKNRIINRYLITEIASVFGLGLAIFTLVLLMGRMVKLVEMVVSNGVPPLQVLKLIMLLLPSFMMLTIPMAFLLAVLLAFGRLSSDNEITVMKACGMSLTALVPPVLITAVLAAMLTLLISLYAVPWGNSGFKLHTLDMAKKYAATSVKERVFRDDLPGIVMYVDQYDEERRLMKRVMIEDVRDPSRPLTIFAKDGLIAVMPDNSKIRLLLRNGSIHSQDSKGEYQLVSFAEYQLTTETGKSDGIVRVAADMPLSELLYNARQPNQDKHRSAKMITEYHSRLALPFAPLVFALLAIPLGIQNQRAGKSAGFTVSIFVLLSYYILLSVLRTLAENGRVEPFIALWTPNLLFLMLGAGLWYMSIKERSLWDALVTAFIAMRRNRSNK